MRALNSNISICIPFPNHTKVSLHTHTNKTDSIKLLEKKIGKIVSDITYTNIFLNQFPKAVEIKTKINKWDLIKLKSFFTAKETIKKMKRKLTEWAKIVANDAKDKGLKTAQTN